jgi:hypothetical protein
MVAILRDNARTSEYVDSGRGPLKQSYTFSCMDLDWKGEN